jgi:mRNA-degrading endonuclease RelE of RelBE toxin-antitoxin system
MNAKDRYSIIYAPQVIRHLKAIDRKYHSLIRKNIESQLVHNPNVETRNKKPLKPPVELAADWEIRFGPDNRFRVFYEVNKEKLHVFILAIGVKKGNRLFIGREEITL